MRELAFPTPPDSSNVIAETVTVTLEDGTLVRFAHIASTFYVRDESLGIWDRAYMICVAEGYLTYMRSPEVYKGADAMIVHRSPVLSETSDVITSACPLLTPALEQVFQIDPVRPRFFVDEHGAVRAVELFWERIGLRTHSAYDDGTQGRWEEVRPVPVHGELPARHVEIAVVPYPATMVLLEGDGGKMRHDGRVVTDVLECRRGGGLRLQYEGGAEHVLMSFGY